MITQLPDEIVTHILSFVPNSLSNLKNKLVLLNSPLNDHKKLDIIASNRIALAYKITRKQHDMRKKIMRQLNIMLKCSVPMRGTPKYDCVYFAPVASGEQAKCRFCSGTKHHHKISNAFIEKHYLPLFLNSY